MKTPFAFAAFDASRRERRCSLQLIFASIFILLLLAGPAYAGNYGTLLLSRCQSLRGNGRCVPSADCCRGVGGSPEQEIITTVSTSSGGGYGTSSTTTPRTSCSAYETCCLISPTAKPNSCNQCGVKGYDNNSPAPVAAISASSSSSYGSQYTTTIAPPLLPYSSLQTLYNSYGFGRQSNNKNSVLVDSSRTLNDNVDKDDAKNVVKAATAAAAASGATNDDVDSIFTPRKFWGRIVGGTDSRQREWCWQVALIDRDTGMVFGGGTLIAQNWVLTAAHKIRHRTSDDFVMVLGRTDFADQNEDSRIAVAREMIVHKDFNETTFQNDIALIRIPDAPCENGNICTICIDDQTIIGSPMQVEDFNPDGSTGSYGSSSSPTATQQPAGYGRLTGMRRSARDVHRGAGGGASPEGVKLVEAAKSASSNPKDQAALVKALKPLAVPDGKKVPPIHERMITDVNSASDDYGSAIANILNYAGTQQQPQPQQNQQPSSSPTLYSYNGGNNNNNNGGGDSYADQTTTTTITINSNAYVNDNSGGGSSSGGKVYGQQSPSSSSSYATSTAAPTQSTYGSNTQQQQQVYAQQSAQTTTVQQSNAQYDRCVITGWGATADHVTSPVLQKADVAILGPQTCVAAMLAASVKNFTTPPNMFCAKGIGSATVNTCDGDGGGPLACRENGIWYVKGITTLGVQDCQNVVAPALFLDVAAYKQWIERNLHGSALPQPGQAASGSSNSNGGYGSVSPKYK